MITREKRGAIITTSSIASLFPSNIYNASKVFDDYFSRGLAHEYRDKLDTISLRPAFVKTNIINMSDKAWKSNKAITPNECVRGCLNDLGYERTTAGGLAHKY
mmetsp:Transcript_52068/g.79063  ORF Transcript_52068/g.79063 Transcript_52068/m.79063 type:complete len:103 (-) Transcript_52068:84-392(-)